MKILVFTTAYDPLLGGAEVALKETIERLPQHQFDIITAKHRKNLPRYEERGHIRIFRVGFGTPLDRYWYALFLLAPFKAWQLMKQNSYDFAWAMMANQAGGSAWFVNRLLKMPYLLTLQEGDSEAWVSKRMRIPFVKGIYLRAQYIQTISNYLAKRAKEFDAPAHVEVVPNGIDVEKFKRQDEKSKIEIRERLNLPQNKKIVMTISRLVKKNAVEDLIEAVSKIDDLFLLIVADGPLRKELEEKTRNLEIEGRVRFAGEIPNEKTPQYVQAADYFARPSESEGLGISFLEGMACGLPVVATEVGGIPDIVKHEYNGLFCKVHDPEDLAKQIRRLIDNPEFAQELGRNAFEFAQAYNWNKIAQDIDKVFQQTKSAKPKVLLATGIYPPDIGGPAGYTKTLAQELNKQKYGVSVLTYADEKDTRYKIQDTKNSQYSIYKIARRGNKLKQYWTYFWHVFKMGRYYDVIYLQDVVSAGLPVMLAAKLTRTPYAVKIVGDYAWEQGQQRFGVKDLLDNFDPKNYGWQVRLLRGIETMVANNAKNVITPSNYLKEIVSKWGIKTPIKVIYNAVEVEHFLDKRMAKQELSLHSTTLLSIGRLVPWKGFESLIEIIDDLKNELPDLKLVIIGDGPQMKDLQSLIRQKELQKKVILTGGLAKDKVVKYMSASDVFILNSGYEGLPHVVVEAMQAGLPAAVSNIGGNPEIVQDGKTGLLFSYNNKAEIKEAIKKLLKDEQLREQLTTNAKQSIGEKFAYDHMISETLSELMRIY